MSHIVQVPDEWIQKALYLDLPFDNVKRTHFQYQGYEHSEYIKLNICNLPETLGLKGRN